MNKKQIIIFIFYGKIEVFSVNDSLWISLGLTKILLIANNLQLSFYYFLVALGGCVQLEPQVPAPPPTPHTHTHTHKQPHVINRLMVTS